MKKNVATTLNLNLIHDNHFFSFFITKLFEFKLLKNPKKKN